MPVTYSEAISAEIRAEMGRQNITAGTLARRLGWGESYLSRRLTGRTDWRAREVQKVAAALGIEVRALTAPAMKAAVTR